MTFEQAHPELIAHKIDGEIIEVKHYLRYNPDGTIAEEWKLIDGVMTDVTNATTSTDKAKNKNVDAVTDEIAELQQKIAALQSELDNIEED